MKRFISVLTFVLLLIMLAGCGKKQYTVTFIKEYSTNEVFLELNVNRKSTVKIETSPIKEGYLFKGWYLDVEPFDFDTPIKNDLVLVAKWERYIIITYDFGYDDLTETELVRKNSKLKPPVDPEREEYVFIGWYESGSLYNFNRTIERDLTLVARWELENLGSTTEVQELLAKIDFNEQLSEEVLKLNIDLNAHINSTLENIGQLNLELDGEVTGYLNLKSFEESYIYLNFDLTLAFNMIETEQFSIIKEYIYPGLNLEAEMTEKVVVDIYLTGGNLYVIGTRDNEESEPLEYKVKDVYDEETFAEMVLNMISLLSLEWLRIKLDFEITEQEDDITTVELILEEGMFNVLINAVTNYLGLDPVETELSDVISDNGHFELVVNDNKLESVTQGLDLDFNYQLDIKKEHLLLINELFIKDEMFGALIAFMPPSFANTGYIKNILNLTLTFIDDMPEDLPTLESLDLIE